MREVQSFDARLEEHIPGLRRYAYALVRDRERADDLVQDCLARALSRRHLWRPGNLRGWLFRILHNVYVNDVARAAIRPDATALDSVAEPSIEPTQDDVVYFRRVATRLAELPADQREVLLLVGLEGFAYEEAARVLGVPVGTIMSRLSRGRRRLRELLADVSPTTLRRVK